MSNQSVVDINIVGDVEPIKEDHPWRGKHIVYGQKIKATWLKKHFKFTKQEIEELKNNTTDWIPTVFIQSYIEDKLNDPAFDSLHNYIEIKEPTFVKNGYTRQRVKYWFKESINTSTCYLMPFLYVDHSKIDIHQTFEKIKIPDLDILKSVLPKCPGFDTLNVWALDIETYSLSDSPTIDDPVSAVGFLCSDGRDLVYYLNNRPKSDFATNEDWIDHLHEKEYQLLTKVSDAFLELQKIDHVVYDDDGNRFDVINIFTLHYGLTFDMNHLYHRFQKHDIFCSVAFDVKKKTKENTGGLDILGNAPKYYPTVLGGWYIVDTFQLFSVLNKMNPSGYRSLRLKELAIQEGITKPSGRLELSKEELNLAVESGDYSDLLEYLYLDVFETLGLFNKAYPPIYEQTKIIPLSPQEIHLVSPAKKVNVLIKYLYYELCSGYVTNTIHVNHLQSEKTQSYEGGLGIVNPGIYKNVCDADVTAEYPSVIETYSLSPFNDVENFFVAIVILAKTESNALKQKAKEAAKRGDHALAKLIKVVMRLPWKVIANGASGAVGTTGYSFNDYECAALITGSGRAILLAMIAVLNGFDIKLIEAATDGVKFELPQDLTQQHIMDAMVKALPKGIGVESEVSDSCGCITASKNYFFWDSWQDMINNKQPKLAGFLNKRSTPLLYIEFAVQYVREYFINGVQAAETYAQQVKDKLLANEVPITDLLSRDKIASNHKKKVRDLNQPHGTRCCYVIQKVETYNNKPIEKHNPKTDNHWIYVPVIDESDNSLPYWGEFYVYNIEQKFHNKFKTYLLNRGESFDLYSDTNHDIPPEALTISSTDDYDDNKSVEDWLNTLPF